MAKLSIVVPAHNEEGNIPTLVQNLQALIKKEDLDAQIVLVDDNSTDSTPSVCDALAKKHSNLLAIHRHSNPGMGAALKQGTHAASGDIIVWVMADLADDFNTIPTLVKRIDMGADLVFGSRYISEGSSGDLQFTKKMLSRGFSVISSLLLGIKVHDITNAFRAFRKNVFTSLKIDSDDFAISPEFALKAHIGGFVLDESPTVYKQRREGIPKFKMGKMGVKYVKILVYSLWQRYKFF